MLRKITSLVIIFCFTFSNANFAFAGTNLRTMSSVETGTAADIKKDLGGPKATNPITNQAIKDWIEQGKVVKLRLRDNVFYTPKFIEGYIPGESDDFEKNNVLKEPFLSRNIELPMLRAYLNQLGINIDEVTIAIVKDQAVVNPTGDDKFSIVHSGERGKIIYIGELLLKDLLTKRMGEDPHSSKIFAHDVKHITDPKAALAEHKTDEYKTLVEEVRARCDKLTALAKGPAPAGGGILAGDPVKPTETAVGPADGPGGQTADTIEKILADVRSGKCQLQEAYQRISAISHSFDRELDNLAKLGTLLDEMAAEKELQRRIAMERSAPELSNALTQRMLGRLAELTNQTPAERANAILEEVNEIRSGTEYSPDLLRRLLMRIQDGEVLDLVEEHIQNTRVGTIIVQVQLTEPAPAGEGKIWETPIYSTISLTGPCYIGKGPRYYYLQKKDPTGELHNYVFDSQDGLIYTSSYFPGNNIHALTGMKALGPSDTGYQELVNEMFLGMSNAVVDEEYAGTPVDDIVKAFLEEPLIVQASAPAGGRKTTKVALARVKDKAVPGIPAKAKKGAGAGHVSRKQHKLVMSFLTDTKARSAGKRIRGLEERIVSEITEKYYSFPYVGADSPVEVYSVPGMYTKTGLRSYCSVKDGIVYVDRDTLNDSSGLLNLEYEVLKLKALISYAQEQGWTLDQLISWRDEKGEPEEVAKLFSDIHSVVLRAQWEQLREMEIRDDPMDHDTLGVFSSSRYINRARSALTLQIAGGEQQLRTILEDNKPSMPHVEYFDTFGARVNFKIWAYVPGTNKNKIIDIDRGYIAQRQPDGRFSILHDTEESITVAAEDKGSEETLVVKTASVGGNETSGRAIDKGGVIALWHARPHHGYINDDIEKALEESRVKKLTVQELGELGFDQARLEKQFSPELLTKLEVFCIYIYPDSDFSRTCLSHPGKGKGNLNPKQRCVYITARSIERIKKLTPDLQHRFWEHELAYLQEPYGTPESVIEKKYPTEVLVMTIAVNDVSPVYVSDYAYKLASIACSPAVPAQLKSRIVSMLQQQAGALKDLALGYIRSDPEGKHRLEPRGSIAATQYQDCLNALQQIGPIEDLASSKTTTVAAPAGEEASAAEREATGDKEVRKPTNIEVTEAVVKVGQEYNLALEVKESLLKLIEGLHLKAQKPVILSEDKMYSEALAVFISGNPREAIAMYRKALEAESKGWDITHLNEPNLQFLRTMAGDKSEDERIVIGRIIKSLDELLPRLSEPATPGTTTFVATGDKEVRKPTNIEVTEAVVKVGQEHSLAPEAKESLLKLINGLQQAVAKDAKRYQESLTTFAFGDPLKAMRMYREALKDYLEGLKYMGLNDPTALGYEINLREATTKTIRSVDALIPQLWPKVSLKEEEAWRKIESISNVVDTVILKKPATLDEALAVDNALSQLNLSEQEKNGLILSIDTLAEGVGAILVNLANKGTRIRVVCQGGLESRKNAYELLERLNRHIRTGYDYEILPADSAEEALKLLGAINIPPAQITYVGTEEEIGQLSPEVKKHLKTVVLAEAIIEALGGIPNMRQMMDSFKEYCIRLGLV